MCQSLKLHPYFVTGFCDGESSFIISIQRKPKYKIGWEVQLCFQIKLHNKDSKLLDAIQNSLGGVGSVTKHKEAFS